MQNPESIAHLSEAQVHLDALKQKLASAPIADDEDFALSIDFQHILEAFGIGMALSRQMPGTGFPSLSKRFRQSLQFDTEFWLLISIT